MKTAFGSFGLVIFLLGLLASAVGLYIYIYYNSLTTLIAGGAAVGAGVLLMLLDMAIDAWGD